MFCVHCGKEVSGGGNFCHHCGGKNLSDPDNVKRAVGHHQDLTSIEEYKKMEKKNKKIGLFWLITPMVTLVVTLSVYAMVSFVINQLAVSGSGIENNYIVVSQIINVVLGLIGIIAVFGMMVGVPIGIVYLNKRVNFFGMKFDTRSGKGKASEIPKEIGGWNWGAAGLTWIWGASHRVWISFLVFIPIVNFIIWVYLGLKGSDLAWRADKWESIEKFLEIERKWKPWGIAFFILGVLATLAQLGAGD